MKIIILAGGLCKEREVSWTTGCLVANALIELGHSVLLSDIYKGIKGKIKFQNKNKYHYEVSDLEPNLEEIKKENNNREELVGPNILKACQKSDVVFNALHGSIGENGKLQAMLDSLGIKYTGTNYLGSALAMHKHLAKQLFLCNGISTPKWLKVNINDFSFKNILKTFDYPLVIKPDENGSSVGVTIVNKKSELNNALKKAFEIDENIIIEEYIKGREFSVGILGNKVLPPIEIIPKTDFYDYQSKYQVGMTIEVCPAEITKIDEKKLKQMALKVHKILNLDVYSRVDILMNEENKLFCLEANSLPGLTPTSLLPQEAKTLKIEYNELVGEILKLSLQKYEG